MHLGPKTDFRKVNDKTKSDSFPIPKIADCIDQIGNAKFVSSFDMLMLSWLNDFVVCSTSLCIWSSGVYI